MQNIFTNFIIINKREQTNITKRVKFINGWLISIAGLQLLWKDLKSIRTLNQKENYVLYTSRLNQDSIENLFCTFRQQNGNNTNPTPYQLLYAFKKNFLLNYFQHSQKANCINDLDAILAQMPTDADLDISTLFADKTPFQFKKICPLSIGQVDYRHLEIPDQNAFIYVFGYITTVFGQETEPATAGTRPVRLVFPSRLGLYGAVGESTVSVPVVVVDKSINRSLRYLYLILVAAAYRVRHFC